jgi:hypothetical protein
MKTIKHCRHVKEDGIACGSPPLRGESYCHSHLRYKGNRLRTWRGRRTLRISDLHLPPPDNFSAITFCLNRVLLVLRSGRLDPDEADEVFDELNQVSIRLGGGDSYASDAGKEERTESLQPDLLLEVSHCESRS